MDCLRAKEREKMKNIGVFGGTFDPIHNGHVALAEEALRACALDRLLVVPAKIQPFKREQNLVDAAHRLRMAALAFAGTERVEASGLEIDNDGISYTIYTLRAVQQRYPDAKIWFVTGIDAFLKVEQWRNAEELLRHYGFIVGLRPGSAEADMQVCLTRQAAIRRIDNRQIDVSSTEIKRRLRCAVSCEGLLPESVERYIVAHGLYRMPEMDEAAFFETRLRAIERLAGRRLSEGRRRHILGVCEAAVWLAKRYGADPEKAETAALFHDLHRDASDLGHGALAARAMKEDYGIDDADLLQAVATHTTGRAGMSVLEKVLYLADIIEPGRMFPGVDQIRELALRELDGACLLAFEKTIAHVQQSGNTLDDATLLARADLMRRKAARETNHDEKGESL